PTASPGPPGWARPQSALTKPPDGDPSAESLSGICRFRGAVCLCNRRLGQRASRYTMDTEYTPLDFSSLAVSQCRDPTWGAMGLRRARLGRLLGVGPGGKCIVHAMANGHSISSFGDDSGKKRHAQSVEYGLGHFDLCAFHLWHVSHAQWGDCL